jgi:hypothetical protein
VPRKDCIYGFEHLTFNHDFAFSRPSSVFPACVKFSLCRRFFCVSTSKEDFWKLPRRSVARTPALSVGFAFAGYPNGQFYGPTSVCGT